jgi:hypothetical protein
MISPSRSLSAVLFSPEQDPNTAGIPRTIARRAAMNHRTLAVLLTGLATAAAPGARAAGDRAEGEGPGREQARQGAEAGLLLPGTVAAAVGAVPAMVTAVSGYDSARGTATFAATADIQLWGPVALRIGASYLPQTPTEKQLQPQVGLRVQLLDQARHGVDFGAGMFFKRERYSQDGGEIQLVLMGARRLGRLGLFGNLAYGQDPEGDDRDGQISVAALYTVGRHLQLGADGRMRFDLMSTDSRRNARGEAAIDLMAGPIASVPVGPMALTAQIGYVAVRAAGPTHTGVAAIGGLARAF